MKKNIFSKILALALCIAVSVSLSSLFAAAEQSNAGGTVEIVFKHEKKPVKDAKFHAYFIAEKTAGEYTLTGDFSKYPVSLENLSADALNGIANALSSFIARDSVKSYADTITGDNGTASFKNLKDGIYLFTGDVITVGNKVLTPKTFIVPIPYTDANGELQYDVTAELKFDSHDVPQSDDTVDRSVKKIWDDDGNSAKRPSSIVVQLLKDGIVFDEATLNGSNNWSHTWNKLDADSTWQVIEKNIADNYVISLDQQGDTFYLTNKYNSETPDNPDNPNEPDGPNTPDSPSNPTNPDNPTNPSNPDNPDNPSTPDNPSNPSNPDNPSRPNGTTPNPENPTKPSPSTTKPTPLLPQTGQLWWPVPLFVIIGIIVFGLGIVLKKRNEASES